MRPEDLENFDALHRLLLVLNDPYAGGNNLAGLIHEIPVLEARLIRTARLKKGHLDVESIELALHVLGNRGLETELLQLLEDMTIAKAEQSG